MAREDPAAFGLLQKRAQKLNSLIDKRTHPQVSVVLQRAFGGLSASAETLSVIFRVGNSIATEARRPKKRSAVTQITIGIKLKLIQERVPQLTEAAELMASGRDVEVYKLLGKRSLQLALEILAKLSGIGYAKDAADILGTLQEVAEAGEAFELRRKQVIEASQLLRWADAITLLTIAWCYSAEEVLLRLAGKRGGSEEAIMEATIKRIVKNARSWKVPTTERVK
jgi:hypothetical protein